MSRAVYPDSLLPKARRLRAWSLFSVAQKNRGDRTINIFASNCRAAPVEGIQLLKLQNTMPVVTSLLVVASCATEPDTQVATTVPSGGTCQDIYPSYWQDPDSSYDEQWAGQLISNRPPAGWTQPVFRLSDDYPRTLVDESADQPWRAASFDALFDPATDQTTKTSFFGAGENNQRFSFVTVQRTDQFLFVQEL